MRRVFCLLVGLFLAVGSCRANSGQAIYLSDGTHLYAGSTFQWTAHAVGSFLTAVHDLSLTATGALYGHDGAQSFVYHVDPANGALVGQDLYWIAYNGTRLVDLGAVSRGLAYDGTYFWSFALMGGNWFLVAFPTSGDASYLANLVYAVPVGGAYTFYAEGPYSVADQVVNGALLAQDQIGRLGSVNLATGNWTTLGTSPFFYPIAYRAVDGGFYGVANQGAADTVFQIGGTYTNPLTGVGVPVTGWTIAAQ